MPCPSASVSSDAGAKITDLLELHPYVAQTRWRPSSLEELVRAVMSGSSGSLRALGSTYSLSRAADADSVISTDRLNLHVSAPLGAARAIAPARMRGGSGFLHQVASDPRVRNKAFVHVEAGVKIKDLFRDLAACGLDLPTSGAGGGQSLAGALSTGSHGADFRVPVLVDWLRAAHLVSTGGKEFWITGSNSPFGGPGAVSAPTLCGDATVIADDAVLDAVRVGVGRFGVVYSFIVEVLPAYSLVEVYLQEKWPELRQTLASSAASATLVTGAFNAPLHDLTSGWFAKEARRRTIVKYSPPTEINPGTASDMDYNGGPPTSLAPVSPTLESRLVQGMLNELGLGELSSALRGDGAKPLYHMNIAISLSEPEKCWVTRRWQAKPDLPKVRFTGPSPTPDRIQQVVENPANHRRPTALIGPLQELLTPDLGLMGGTWLPELAACLGIAAQATRIFAFRDHDVPRICQDHENAGATIGEALFLTLFRLATDPILRPESTQAAAFAVSQLIGGNTVRNFVRCGLASEIIDTHNYNLDGAQSGNSAEYFFDAGAGAHLNFVDQIIDLAKRRAPIFGYIGMRFMPASRSQISMARYPLTASVEVATARSRLDDVYAGFWSDVHSLANAANGVAHWGQEFVQSQPYIEARYGQDLRDWRQALVRVAGLSPVFSTPFTRVHGLEPEGGPPPSDEIDDAIARFMVGLEIADF